MVAQAVLKQSSACKIVPCRGPYSPTHKASLRLSLRQPTRPQALGRGRLVASCLHKLAMHQLCDLRHRLRSCMRMPCYGEPPFRNNMQQSTTHLCSPAFSLHRLLHCCQAMQCPFALRSPPIITMPLVVMVYRCVLCAIIRSSTTVSSIRGCEQCSIAAAMSSSSKCSAAGLSSPAEMGGNGR